MRGNWLRALCGLALSGAALVAQVYAQDIDPAESSISSCKVAPCRTDLRSFIVGNVAIFLGEIGGSCGDVITLATTIASTCVNDLEQVSEDCPCTPECSMAVEGYSVECLTSIRNAFCSSSEKARSEGFETVDAMQSFAKHCVPNAEEILDLNCPEEVEPFDPLAVCNAAPSESGIQLESASDEKTDVSQGGRKLQSLEFVDPSPIAESDTSIEERPDPLTASTCDEVAACTTGIEDWIGDNVSGLLGGVDDCDLAALASTLTSTCETELTKSEDCTCEPECMDAMKDVPLECVTSLKDYLCGISEEARTVHLELPAIISSLVNRCYKPGNGAEGVAELDVSCPEVSPFDASEVCPEGRVYEQGDSSSEVDADTIEGGSKQVLNKVEDFFKTIGNGIADAWESVFG